MFEISKYILTSGKYAGVPVTQLSSSEIFEAHRSCRDSHDLELFRTEKRRRHNLAQRLAWKQAAEAGGQ